MQKLPVVWTPDPSTGIGVGTVGGAPGERAPPKVFSLWHVQSCTVKTACAPPPPPPPQSKSLSYASDRVRKSLHYIKSHAGEKIL